MYKFILRKDISKFQVLRENLNARKNDDIELRGRKMLKLLFCTTQLVYHTAFEKANHKCIVKMMFLIGSRTLKSVFGLYQAVYNRDYAFHAAGIIPVLAFQNSFEPNPNVSDNRNLWSH